MPADSPTPASPAEDAGPCECGHASRKHRDGTGFCMARVDDDPNYLAPMYCACDAFHRLPASGPTPTPHNDPRFCCFHCGNTDHTLSDCPFIPPSSSLGAATELAVHEQEHQEKTENFQPQGLVPSRDASLRCPCTHEPTRGARDA